MGIFIDQWRVSIGLFYRCISSGKKRLSISINIYSVLLLIIALSKLFSCTWHHINSLMVLNFYNLQCFLVILFLLLQAGDIETYPSSENVHELSILLDNFSDFNILCFSETRLDDNVPIEMLFLSNRFSEPY